MCRGMFSVAGDHSGILGLLVLMSKVVLPGVATGGFGPPFDMELHWHLTLLVPLLSRFVHH